jgi:hypothetical protein
MRDDTDGHKLVLIETHRIWNDGRKCADYRLPAIKLNPNDTAQEQLKSIKYGLCKDLMLPNETEIIVSESIGNRNSTAESASRNFPNLLVTYNYVSQL